MKARVLVLVTSFLRFKGDDSFTFECLRRAAKRGPTYDVVVPHDRENSKSEEVAAGIRIHRFSYFFPRRLQAIAYHGGAMHNISKSLSAKAQAPLFMLSFFIKALKHAKGKDLIHAQWLPSCIVAAAIKKLTGKPFIVWVQRMFYGNGIAKTLNFWALKQADFIMFNSTYTLAEAMKGFKPKNYAIVPNGVDLKQFRPGPKSGVSRKAGVPAGAKIVFSIGRFVEVKGFEYLINAMGLVKTKNAVCVIAGYGPLESKFKSMAAAQGLQGKVFLIGRLPNAEVPLWMNESDAVVVSSIIDSTGETESLGITAIEAIACGRPLIASRAGGIVDVVKDGYNGFLVKPKSAEELAQKIDLVLGAKGLEKKFGKNARRHCEENFNWEKIVDKMMEIYGLVLGRRCTD